MSFPTIKSVVVFADVSKTAGATATGMIDRKGYNYVSICLREPTQDVVSNKPTVMKVTESDTTNLTDAVAIVRFTGGTSTSTSVGFVITAPPNTTATSERYINIDCRARKRYLFLSVSPAVTQIIGANAVLSRPEQALGLGAPVLQMIEG